MLTITSIPDHRSFEELGPHINEIHLVGQLTGWVFDILEKRAPNLKLIELGPSLLASLPFRMREKCRAKGIVLKANCLPPLITRRPPEPRDPHFASKRRILRSLRGIGRRRLQFLLKNKYKPAQDLLAYYGVRARKNSAASSEAPPQFLTVHMRAVFACIHPTQVVDSKVLERAWKLYLASFAQAELEPFLSKLKKIEVSFQAAFEAGLEN